jgi:uncharacterized RDD family membrane protein YckC
VLVAASASDRLRALTIDTVLLSAVLVAPVTVLSDAGHEVAAVASAVLPTAAFLGGCVARRGRTIGQSLLGLSVVDADTLGRVPPIRAFPRSLIIALEVLGTATIILSPPALAELASARLTGRSLTDRLLRTTVLVRR